MAVRGTASAGKYKWNLSHRYVEGVIDRATHRTILMRRMSPRLQMGLEINESAGEVNPVANYRAVSETLTRPAVIFGTSSDRIGTPSGQSYYVTVSKALHHATGLPIAPYIGLSWSEYEDRFLMPYGLNVALGNQWSATYLHDGAHGHYAATYAWQTYSVTALWVFREHLGINFSVAF